MRTCTSAMRAFYASANHKKVPLNGVELGKQCLYRCLVFASPVMPFLFEAWHLMVNGTTHLISAMYQIMCECSGAIY